MIRLAVGFSRRFYIASIDRRLRQQALAAEVVLVISNNSRAGALRRADAAGENQHISGKTHGSHEGADRHGRHTNDAQVDWVLLLGC